MKEELASQTIHRLVAEFLEVLPDNERRVAYLSAIPNAIHPTLLKVLTSNEKFDEDFLGKLHDNYLLDKGEGGWYSYSPEVRQVLHDFWRQPEQHSEYQTANRLAMTYFDRLAAQTSPPGNYVYAREALYHQLLEDEEPGLEKMADLFEDACDQRQIGAAQNYSIQLSRILPELSPLAAQYASYYEMRIDFMLNHRKDLEERLSHLIAGTSDPLLKARSGLLLGRVLLSRYEWKRSRDVLKASLEELKHLKAWRFAARGMLALGDVYVDLVENSGGIRFGSSTDRSRLSQLLTQLLFLPFLLLDWLRRKIWFLPGWFYFGGNYQEWILNYLLQMAGGWYRRARHTAQRAGDDLTLQNALLGEANIAVQQGRAAKARRKYSRLAILPSILSSQYRLAQVHYGRGLVALMENQAGQALLELQSALNTYRFFADESNIGKGAFALGRAYLQAKDPEAAAGAILLAFQAFNEMQDAVPQTQVAWELELLVEKKQLRPETELQIAQALPLLQERQFVAHFPTDLLRRFRNLAYWIVFPISYFLGLIFGLAACLLLVGVESAADNIVTGTLTSSDILFLIVVGFLPVVMNFWIFQILYSALGQLWVLIIGHISLNTLGEQPDRICLGQETLMVDSPGLHQPVQMRWEEIEKIVSADYRLWQRTIYLFSRLGIVGNGRSIIVDGITSGYRQIRKEIAHRKGDLFLKPDADTVILTHPSTYLAILFALLHAVLLIQRGQFVITIQEETKPVINLHVPSLLAVWIFNLLLILPPLLLWRVNLNRRRFSKQLGKRPRKLLNFISFGISMLLTIIAILWLIASPVIKIGEDEILSQQSIVHSRPVPIGSLIVTMNSPLLTQQESATTRVWTDPSQLLRLSLGLVPIGITEPKAI